MIYILILLILAACQNANNAPPPTNTPQVITKLIATVGPTNTPSEDERQATRQSIISTPTQAPPTTIPTITPYVGVFIGEAQVDNINRPIGIETPIFRSTPIPSGSEPLLCSILPADEFGRSWEQQTRVVNSLGCPIQESFGFIGRFQLFESGAMYFNPATNEVWAVRPGTLIQAGQYWYVDQPPPITTENIRAPQGLLVPEAAIGAAWAGVAEITQNLGFATAPEQDSRVNVQRFEGGTLFLDVDAGQVFALFLNGDSIGPIDRGAIQGG